MTKFESLEQNPSKSLYIANFRQPFPYNCAILMLCVIPNRKLHTISFQMAKNVCGRSIKLNKNWLWPLYCNLLIKATSVILAYCLTKISIRAKRSISRVFSLFIVPSPFFVHCPYYLLTNWLAYLYERIESPRPDVMPDRREGFVFACIDMQAS